MHKNLKTQSGFTLAEMIVVFAILSILATAFLSVVGIGALRRSRDTQRKANLTNISKTLEIYFNDHGEYPASNGAGQIMGCGATADQICYWGAEWSDTTTSYINPLPTDPRSSSFNLFYRRPSAVSWQLYTMLEDGDDPVVNGPFAGTDCAVTGTTQCNYGISSGNTTP